MSQDPDNDMNSGSGAVTSSSDADDEQEQLSNQTAGGFLIRLANFAHLDNQSDSEKKQNAIRKPSARNDQIRVLFGSPP
jgi:hypothetical protein